MSETDSSGGVTVPVGEGTDPHGTTFNPTPLPEAGQGPGPEFPAPGAHPVPQIDESTLSIPTSALTAAVAVGVAAAAGLSLAATPFVAAGAAAAAAAAFLTSTLIPDQRMLAEEGNPDDAGGDLDGDGLSDT